MDVSWKNLVVLLRNNAVSGKTSCQSIVECVHKYELPDLFDEITTNYLLSDDLSTRVNSSLLLEKLCEKFSAELAPLLQNSDSDGVLLPLDNIDLCSVANDEANCLYSGKSNYSMENRAGKVYRKDWLQRQRQELMHRLGLEVTSTYALVAVEYSEEEALLDESDLIPTVNFLETSKNGSLNVMSTMTESKDEGLALTDETWFARLVRFMVIGLVDQQWEVRHGCCLGLDGVIHGLFSLSSEETRSPALFLVNDILCCGLCLLGLDRFLDADPDNSSSAITPVKHMAARLVATMLVCSSSSPALRQFDLVFASLVAMCGGGAQTVEVHWSVAMGGLTGLTHVAPLAVKRDVVSVCPMLRVCADVVCGNWVVDDLFTAVAGLLSEVAAAVQQSISSAPRSSISISSAQIVDCLRELRRVVTGLDQLCSRIAEDSTCYVSLWRISACVTHLVSLCAEICPTDPAVMAEVAEGVVSVQRSASNLAEQLSIFSDSVRHTSCSEITQYLLSLATLLRFLKCESKWIGPCWVLAGTLLAVFGVSSAVTSSTHPLNSHPEEGDVMFSPLRRLEVIRAMGVALGGLLQLCTAEGTDAASPIADGNTMLSRVLQVWCAAQIPTVEPLECVGAVVASKPKRRKGAAASQTSAEAGYAPERADKTRSEEDIAVAARESVRKVLGPTCDGSLGCLTLVLTAMFKVFTTAKVSRLQKCAETADSSLTGPGSSHWLLSDESSNLACAELVDALLCSSATQCTMDVFSTVGNEVKEVVETFLLKVKPAATGSGKAATTRPSLRFVFVADTDKKATGRKRGAAHMEEDEAASLLATTCAPSLIATAQTGTASQRAVFASLEGLLLTAIFLRSTIGGGEIVEATVASVVSAVRRACALLRKQMQQHLDFLARWLSAVHLRDCSSLCHLLLSAPPGTAGYIPAMSTMLAKHVARCHREDDVHDSAGTALISLVAALRSGDVDKRAVAMSAVGQIATIMDASLLRIPSIRDILTCDSSPRGPEFIYLLNCIVPHLSDEALIGLVRDCHVIAAILGAFVATARMVGEAESLLTEATLCVLVSLVARDAALTGGELLQQCAAEVRSRLVLNGGDAADPSDQQGLVSRLFFGLTSQLNDLLLPQFPAWFDIALHGLGSCEPTVRRPCTAVFCLLVPLAPLAKEILSSGRNGKVNSGGDTVDSALLKQLFAERGELERSAGEATDEDRLVLSIGAVAADQLSQTTNLMQEVCPRSAHVSVGDGVAVLSPRGLRRYQWEGVAWLTQLRRCGVNGILADEMGLGKSLQALTVIAVLRAERLFKTAPSLIVCPASLTLHWEQEITKFFPPSLLAPARYVPPGKGVNRNSSADAAAPQSNQVVIVSYDTLRANLQRFTAALWEYVVLDEAHLVKNPRTATAQAVFALRCKHRVALTGTPVQNQVDELWSLMNFLIPDYLGGFKEFRTQVVAPVLRFMNERIQLKQQEQQLFGGSADDQCADSGSKKAKAERNKSVARFNQVVEVSATGINLLRRLHKQVLPFILRRTKAAVASELPSKTIVDVMCPLSAVQRQLYASFQRGLRLSDESLEQELRAVREGRALTTAPVASLESPSLMQLGCGFEDEDSPWNDNGSKALHPLQALTYLKLLSVHPCLAISTKHKSYRNRLLNEFDSSGKLLQLTRVLLDSGVMLRHEFRAAGRTSFDVLFAVDPVAAASNEDSDSEEDGEAEKISTSSDSEADSSSAVRTETKTSAAQADSFAAAPKKRATISKKKSAAKKQLDAEVAVAAPAHRCLIFVQHKAALDLIESLVLRKYFPSVQYRRLDGDVPSAKRAAVARQFNDQPRYGSEGVFLKDALQDTDLRDLMPSVALRVPSAAATAAEQSIETQNDVRLLLMTTGSCGLGLNLTAADTVIFVEHNWNPFVDLQAMDRAHRIGQTSPVTVYRLLAESTIEARIVGLQGAKQLVASEVINEDNTGGLNSNRGFGGMLWDSLVIYNSQEQQGNIEGEPGSEEDINLDEFLSSVGQT